ncbi:hypothetical protein ACVZHT_12930, partial [Vibrio diabolicus]
SISLSISIDCMECLAGLVGENDSDAFLQARLILMWVKKRDQGEVYEINRFRESTLRGGEVDRG